MAIAKSTSDGPMDAAMYSGMCPRNPPVTNQPRDWRSVASAQR